MQRAGVEVRRVVEVDDKCRPLVLFQQLDHSYPLEELDDRRLGPTVGAA
jgi:hypothetical protein